jgi:transcriptional antiterminator RfaH
MTIQAKGQIEIKRPTGPRWFVCQSHPGQEKVALANLRNQGFEGYLPLALVEIRKHGQPNRMASLPLFPRYLFARLDTDAARWRAIFSTVGIQTMLCAGDRPSPVPDRLIADIQAQELKGLVQLRPRDAGDRFEPGQKVTYDQLLTAVFQERVDAKRSLILVSLLSTESLQTVDSALLAPAAPS